MEKKNNSRFFCNSECEYFPCHKGIPEDAFNCLFCYCPLYAMGDECGGNFCYTEKGVKNCTGCTWPHKAENYSAVIRKLKAFYGKTS